MKVEYLTDRSRACASAASDCKQGRCLARFLAFSVNILSWRTEVDADTTGAASTRPTRPFTCWYCRERVLG